MVSVVELWDMRYPAKRAYLIGQNFGKNIGVPAWNFGSFVRREIFYRFLISLDALQEKNILTWIFDMFWISMDKISRQTKFSADKNNFRQTKFSVLIFRENLFSLFYFRDPSFRKFCVTYFREFWDLAIFFYISWELFMSYCLVFWYLPPPPSDGFSQICMGLTLGDLINYFLVSVFRCALGKQNRRAGWRWKCCHGIIHLQGSVFIAII